MQITYFSKYDEEGPSSRYRIFQMLPYFDTAGAKLTIHPLFDRHYLQILRSGGRSSILKKTPYVLSRFNRRRHDLQKNQAPLSIIEQQLFPYIPFVLEKKVLPGRFLIEFDDAIYLTHPRKLPPLFAKATAIIAGNETLAAYAANYNRHVHIVPTVLDLTKFRKDVEKRASERIRIGWTGLEYNYPYLKTLEPVFESLIRKFDVEIVILSGSPPANLSIPFRFEKWNAAKEVEQISQFDIGVMPLKMDEWSRGKCGMKLLQFMALEIPAVVTGIGVNLNIVQHGENGFLAETLREWESSLSTLIQDSDLRDKIGGAGRSTVEQKYSLQLWFKKILDIYQKYYDS